MTLMREIEPHKVDDMKMFIACVVIQIFQIHCWINQNINLVQHPFSSSSQ